MDGLALKLEPQGPVPSLCFIFLSGRVPNFLSLLALAHLLTLIIHKRGNQTMRSI